MRRFEEKMKSMRVGERMSILVTGSSGLIGSEAVEFYDKQGHAVIGVDNNMRAAFFGPAGDTRWNLLRLKRATKNFRHYPIDIRSEKSVFDLFKKYRFDLVIHCAAQPSHDTAAKIPIMDFQVNALGTLHLLEATRRFCSEAVFIHMSTNKVYGDAPNEIPLIELETRYDYARPEDKRGINEECRIDRSLHSLFGASKLAGDIMAQEYGRYFSMKIGIFRGGCLTGPAHSGVEQHGFLNYLVKVAVKKETYKIFGYKGKQVRDNIHSYDVIQAFEAFRQNPRPGEVYNLGGGRGNSISIIEAISKVELLIGQKINVLYQDNARKGDHICYISDLRKMYSHFPGWRISRSLDAILREMVEWKRRSA